MKAQYIGDVKDYGKYRFLRLLCKTTGLRLGINWYLTTNDSSKQGNFGSIPNCQDSLYSVVTQLKKPNATTEDVKHSGLLPESTVYYDSLLEYSMQPVNKTRRYNWHQAALKALESCNIIFLDPDTGVIANEYHDDTGLAKDNFFRPSEQRDGTRYVSLTEVKNYLANGKSLILFQYGIRVGGIDAQLHTVSKKLTQFVGKPTASYIFRYSQSANDEIAFICYSQPAHVQRMERFEKSLLNPQTPWGKYFSRWEGSSISSDAASTGIEVKVPSKPSPLGKTEQTIQQTGHALATPAAETLKVNIPHIRDNAPPQEKLRVLVMQIPKGKVTTYGWLATQIYGNSSRTLPVLSMIKSITGTSVPCHRVVSNDGQPKAPDSSYGNTGMSHKELLQREGVIFIGSVTID